LKQGLKYLPENKFLLSSIIKGYLEFGMGPQAFPYLDKHLQYFSTDMKELKEIGHKLMLSGFKEQSLKYLIKAAEIKTGNPASLSEIAIWLNDIGEYDKALNLINGLIAKYPENTRVISDAVYLFVLRRDHTSRVKFLARLKHLPDSYSSVRIFEGMMAESEGKTGEALKQYELSFNASPRNLPLINVILKICYKEKRWDKAVSILRKAADYFPNDPDLQKNLGELYITCEDKKVINNDKGIEYSERAYLNNSSSLPIRVSAAKNLSIAYKNTGNTSKARYYITRANNMASRGDAPVELLNELARITKEISLM
jgi:tetratricopeptide (TPR) repeat protein